MWDLFSFLPWYRIGIENCGISWYWYRLLNFRYRDIPISNVSWCPVVLPGCSLLGSFPLPPLTRGPSLAPAGMSSCTHTWSSARWEPCWTACTCTPNLWWICTNTQTSTRVRNLFLPTEKHWEAEICWGGGLICTEWKIKYLRAYWRCENIFWRL